MGRHYLIGHGERLSEPIVLPRGGATPKDIYTYEESRARLQPELHSAIANLPDDPALAPNDVHVLQMVLHPKYLAKSYHPSGLLRAAGLSLVGSKPVRITTADDPDKGARLSRTLLVAGHRQSLEHFDSLLQDPDVRCEEYAGIKDIVRIERIDNYAFDDKYHPAPSNDAWYELVLHELDEDLAPDNTQKFLELAERLGVNVEERMNFKANNLLYRIESPGDAVNALGVGACDSEDVYWMRAPYSAVGPGRSPGIVKPDLVAFGGTEGNEFMVLGPGTSPAAVPVMGTSFAAPNALRQAVRIREICGPEITPLVAKTLLIHAAERRKEDNMSEIGWGKVPSDATEIVTTEDGRALVIYKGSIRPGKIVRATIPVPPRLDHGDVKIRATFSFTCRVDPQSPDSYTRSTLEVTFRPDANRIDEGKKTARTDSFFSRNRMGTSSLYPVEAERRSDQGKWETVLHSERQFKAARLAKPVFDIHYNAREEGGASLSVTDKLEYALAITISAPKIGNLHQLILDAYPQLISLDPLLGV